jgi:hypothetical protein
VELGGVVALPRVVGLHQWYERRVAGRHSTAGSGLFLAKLTRPLQTSGCSFVTRAGTIATFGAGRFRSANPSAAGLLDLNFRISDTHLQQIEIGVVEPGQLHWMEAMKFAARRLASTSQDRVAPFPIQQPMTECVRLVEPVVLLRTDLAQGYVDLKPNGRKDCLLAGGLLERYRACGWRAPVI